MTLGEWLETWLDVYVEPSKRYAESSKAMYARAVAAVPAWLAAVEMAELTALHCMRWLNSVAIVHERAAQLDRVMLSRALQIARKMGFTGCVIDQDVCPTPEHETREAVIMTADQVGIYVDAAASTDVYPLLLLCLCGLRRGEALGVRRDCFDWQAGTLHVCGQRLRVRGHYRYGRLKTRRSDRVLALPPWILDVCRAWPVQLHSPYLVNTTPEHLHRAHAAIVAAQGLPAVTLHGLRHTMATLAAQQGVPLPLLQNCLGHAKMTLTADLYANHLTSEVSAVPSLVLQGLQHAM